MLIIGAKMSNNEVYLNCQISFGKAMKDSALQHLKLPWTNNVKWEILLHWLGKKVNDFFLSPHKYIEPFKPFPHLHNFLKNSSALC